MRAVHRVAEKVCSTGNERRVFIKIVTLLPREASKSHVTAIFSCLKGEVELNALPHSIQQQLLPLPENICTSGWAQAKTWVQWWTRPIHLSKILYVLKIMCTRRPHHCFNSMLLS